jgi:oligopeptide/dipeptide ABC transporter ATP-binding protein
MLKLDKLRIEITGKGAAGFNVLRELSFTLPPKGVVGILGESGSGKSIMAKSILGLNVPPVTKTGGRIIFKGKELNTDVDFADIRGGGVSMIFQHPTSALNPVFTIGEQLTETVRLHNKQLTKQEAHETAVNLLVQTGINHAADRMKAYPHQFSGGMNQRVMIALALATEPELMIADEPTTALDVITQEQIIRLLLELGDREHFATMFITHDLSLMQKVADTVLVLYAGEMMETLSGEDLREGRIQHPCTYALLQSVPKMHGEKTRLYSIPGQTAKNNADYDNCCIFHERCPQAKAECRQNKPEVKNNVKCFYPMGN